MALSITQIGSLTANTGGTTLPITGVTCAVDDIIVVVTGASNNGGTTGLTVTGVADNGGGGTPNSYTAQSQGGRSTNTWICQIWTAKCTDALTSKTVTVTFGQTIDDRVAYVFKVSGANTTSWVDKNAITGSSGGPTYSLTSGTLAQSDEIVIGGWAVGDDTSSTDGGTGTSVNFTAGDAGFTRVTSLGSGDGAGSSSVRLDMAYKIVSATTTVVQGMGLGANRSAAGALITLKGSSVSPPTNTVAPVIRSAPQVGRTMTTSDGTWVNNPTSFSYQWQRANDAAFTTGVTSIGTNVNNYTSVSADANKYIRCQVTGTNTAGSNTANSNGIGDSLVYFAANGTATAPGVGLAPSDSVVVRRLARARDTDHQSRNITITDHVPVGDTILFMSAYSTSTNWTSAMSDPTANSWVEVLRFNGNASPENLSIDVWGSINVPNALTSGDLIHEIAGGSGAGGIPSNSVIYNILSVSPPVGRTLTSETGATGRDTGTSHVTGSITTSFEEYLLVGFFGFSNQTEPMFTPGTNWTELEDFGNATDPSKQIGIEARKTTAIGSFTASGSSATSGTSDQMILPFKINPSVQKARPSSVISGSWTDQAGSSTGANLIAAINEISPDDTNYIKSPASPGATPAVEEIAFTSLNDPLVSSSHIVRYRYQKDTTGGDTINLTVRLMQGATEIANWSHSNIDSITQADQTLTTGQADSITNYSDLRLRFEATSA